MELHALVRILLRRWWLVVIVPVIVLPVLVFQATTRPYQSQFRAAVLIPGDTEIPGNSERPELMVLDDLPSLIESRAFADAVSADLATKGISIWAESIDGSLTGSRYSRVLTVTVARTNADEATEIAQSAASVLPGIVNTYLVADQSHQASVPILDPPGEPTRHRPNEWLAIAALTIVAGGVGAALALLANAWSVSSQAAAEQMTP